VTPLPRHLDPIPFPRPREVTSLPRTVSSILILRSLLVLMLFGVIGVVGGCDNQAGSISVKDAPPAGLESETRPLKSAPVPPKGR
jgi:hypothetical protein